MSGLYNALFGQHDEAESLLEGLKFEAAMVEKKLVVGRFRDAWIERHGDSLLIRIHTRMGGNNRDEYAESIASIRDHPWYDHDEDLGYDSTYADFYFRPPAKILEETPHLLEEFSAVAIDPVDVAGLWAEKIESLASMSPEEVEATMRRVTENVDIVVIKPEDLE